MSGVTDPIADYLNRIRNAQEAGKTYVDIPASKLKRAVTQILVEKGYVRNYLNVEDGKQGLLRVYLKYDPEGEPVIRELTRISKPGRRRFVGADELPRVRNGLGVAIISTSQGVMTDKEARKVDVGGEVVATVF